MIKAFFAGIVGASRNWKMVLLLLIANILFTLPMAVIVFILIVMTGSGALTANRIFADKLDINWITDLFNYQLPGYSLESLGIQMGGLLVVLVSTYLLLNTLIAGGILEVFASHDRHFTMQKFWSGCGAYFSRFFRLLLVSLFFYGLAFVTYILVNRSIGRLAEQATEYQAIVYKRWAAMLLLLLLLSFINMVFDYARIGTVINNSRKMFEESIEAFRFSFRHFYKTFGLYLLIATMGIALFLFFAGLRWSIDQSSAGALFLAILLGQVAIAVRMWTRLIFFSAELNMYQSLKPEPKPESVPVYPREVNLLTAARGQSGYEEAGGWHVSSHHALTRTTGKAEDENKEGV